MFQSFVLTWTAAIALLLGAGAASGQALHSERFANGSELVFVTQPLAGATTLAWPEADGVAHAVTLGQLNLVADAQRELAAADPPPPVVVVVGGTQFAEQNLIGFHQAPPHACSGGCRRSGFRAAVAWLAPKSTG